MITKSHIVLILCLAQGCSSGKREAVNRWDALVSKAEQIQEGTLKHVVLEKLGDPNSETTNQLSYYLQGEYAPEKVLNVVLLSNRVMRVQYYDW